MTEYNGILVDENAEIYSYKGKKEDLVLPDTAKSVSRRAFAGNRDLVSVYIPSNVESVGAEAFADCPNLKRVYFGKGVKRIATGAFRGCAALEKVFLPEGLEKLGAGVFDGCESLQDTSEDEYRYVGTEDDPYFAFIGYTKSYRYTPKFSLHEGTAIIAERSTLRFRIDEIELPNGLKHIGDYAFEGVNADKVKLPDSVLTIGKGVFRASHVSKVVLSARLKEIPSLAFAECSGLNDCPLPDSVERVATDAFWASPTYPGIGFAQRNLHERKMSDAYAWTAGRRSRFDDREEMEKFVRSHRAAIAFRASEEKDLKAFKGVLPFYTRPIPPAELDRHMENVRDDPEFTDLMVRLKNQWYSPSRLARMEKDKEDKAFGLKPYSAEEWRKTFRFTVNDKGGYTVTGYKEGNDVVCIPDRIGKRTVTAVRILSDFAEYAPSVFIVPETVTNVDVDAFDRKRSGVKTLIVMGKQTVINDYGKKRSLKIRAPLGSNAEAFAEERGYAFEELRNE